MIYVIKDFLFSRNGKILVLCAVLIFCIFNFDKFKPKNSEAPEGISAQQSALWGDDADDQQAPLKQLESNKSFNPFTPLPSKSEKLHTPEPPQEKTITFKPTPVAAIELSAPLFKEERTQQKQTTQNIQKPFTLPKLEAGAIIHCQLLTPATTDTANAPVIARSTHAVIRDGITIIPRGSRLFGKIQTSKNKRVFFSPNWKISIKNNQSLTLSAQVQEKNYNHQARRYNPSDGRLGLPAFVENDSPKKKSNFLHKLVKGIGRFGKDTVRSGIGDYVPATGRNIAIDITSTVIDEVLPKPKKDIIKQTPYLNIPAGREFYLVVSNIKQATQSSPDLSIDELLRKAMQRRLAE